MTAYSPGGAGAFGRPAAGFRVPQIYENYRYGQSRKAVSCGGAGGDGPSLGRGRDGAAGVQMRLVPEMDGLQQGRSHGEAALHHSRVV